ncbi:MAG: GNAT family N-acetyltransferase [Nitrososphaerota archaeon]|nr:GNAT family N-acetyltransferase [Nitrososphaerota archaeon]MDG6938813.1 GNAT family N-acetyltransferase [Nitrososphaerota archaeon]
MKSAAYEMNEVGWWSNWASVTWQTKNCYVIHSREYGEPLFNHCGFLSPEDPGAIGQAERLFAEQGAEPSFFVPDLDGYDRVAKSLEGKGYASQDELVVMEMGRPAYAGRGRAEVSAVGPRGLTEWVRVYVQSFYEELVPRQVVRGSLKRAAGDARAILLLARLDGLPVGTTALYEDEEMVGAYCVGVLPEFRRQGVAASMMRFAHGVARERKKRLVLQTFRADSAQGFYERLGFHRVYTKKVYLREPPTGDAPRRPPPRFDFRREGETHADLGVRIDRQAKPGAHAFSRVFRGFEKLEALKSVFGDRTGEELAGVTIVIDPRRGYMHVDDENGSVYVSQPYLESADQRYIYLDIIHELVHVKQFREGRELYDERFTYFERPTEVEAYGVAVAEARRIGMTKEELVEYLKVEWVEGQEFLRFLEKVGLGR